MFHLYRNLRKKTVKPIALPSVQHSTVHRTYSTKHSYFKKWFQKTARVVRAKISDYQAIQKTGFSKCQATQGTGFSKYQATQGTGFSKCQATQGTGFSKYLTTQGTGFSKCQATQGTGFSKCQATQGTGFFKCQATQGTGFFKYLTTQGTGFSELLWLNSHGPVVLMTYLPICEYFVHFCKYLTFAKNRTENCSSRVSRMICLTEYW